MAERRYPLWLDICSGVALLMTAGGLLTVMWQASQPFHRFESGGALLVAAAGFFGIWVTGTLAARMRRAAGGDNG